VSASKTSKVIFILLHSNLNVVLLVIFFCNESVAEFMFKCHCELALTPFGLSPLHVA
jgi:hypothetical protein